MSDAAYDPERAPDPARWLAAAQEARVAAVVSQHAASPGPHPAVSHPRVHAALHVLVEDQLARNDPPEVARAVERLVRGGRRRHEALHAVGEVASAALAASLSGGGFDPRAYARALDSLGVDRPPSP